MNWKKIDPENLPSGEVLFKSGYHPHVYFGRLVLDDDDIWCEKELAYFNSVTHYFDPADLGEPDDE